jgi:hypothetical protein
MQRRTPHPYLYPLLSRLYEIAGGSPLLVDTRSETAMRELRTVSVHARLITAAPAIAP